MMKSKRRTYDKEFKLEVVKRSLGDITVKDLAEELDISPVLISKWRKQYIDSGEQLSFPGRGNESLTEEQKENRRLKKALREKELELEILKKAISIFSKKGGINTNS